MLDKSDQFLLSEPKSLNVASNIAGVEKNVLRNLGLRSTWRPIFDSSFEPKEALFTVEICVLCGRGFSNHFEIMLCVGGTF